MWQKHTYSKTGNRRGASLLSYGLVVGLISVVALSAVTSVGSSGDFLFTQVGETLEDVTGGATAQQASATPEATPAGIAADCAAILSGNPSAPDGVYQIDPDGDTTGTNVWCDMTTSGGGWTRVFYSHDSNQDAYVNWTATDFTFETHGTVDSGASWSVVLPDLSVSTIMIGCATGNSSSMVNVLTDSSDTQLVDYIFGQRGRTGRPDTFGNTYDTNIGIRADQSAEWDIWYLQDNATDNLSFGENGETYGYETTAYDVAQCRGTAISASNALIVQVR